MRAVYNFGNDPGYHYPINALTDLPLFKLSDTSTPCTLIPSIHNRNKSTKRIYIFILFNTSEVFKSGFYKITRKRDWIMGK